MVSDSNERVYITLSKESVERLEFYAKKMGMTRSALGAYLIGQGILGLEKATQIADGVQNELAALVKREVKRAIAEKAG